MSANETYLSATPGMETQFVEADAYCRLVTSRRYLVRMDDHARGLRGLLDPDARVYYVVEERKLLYSRPEQFAAFSTG